MASRRPFLLRLDTALLDALNEWAHDELRSLNGQIEFVLRRALADAGRRVPTASRRLDSAAGEKGATAPKTGAD